MVKKKRKVNVLLRCLANFFIIFGFGQQFSFQCIPTMGFSILQQIMCINAYMAWDEAICLIQYISSHCTFDDIGSPTVLCNTDELSAFCTGSFTRNSCIFNLSNMSYWMLSRLLTGCKPFRLYSMCQSLYVMLITELISPYATCSGVK